LEFMKHMILLKAAHGL